MRSILTISFIVLSHLTFAQKTDCSEFLKNISIDWKSDSLTKTGFRNNVAKQILACKSLDLSPQQLVEYLGKPFNISNWTQGRNKRGTGYSYFFWHSDTPPGKTPFESLAVTFNFDENGKFLYVAENMYCY